MARFRFFLCRYVPLCIVSVVSVVMCRQFCAIVGISYLFYYLFGKQILSYAAASIVANFVKRKLLAYPMSRTFEVRKQLLNIRKCRYRFRRVVSRFVLYIFIKKSKKFLSIVLSLDFNLLVTFKIFCYLSFGIYRLAITGVN